MKAVRRAAVGFVVLAAGAAGAQELQSRLTLLGERIAAEVMPSLIALRAAEPGEAAPELVAYLLERLEPPMQGVLSEAREAVALGERIQAALEALDGSDASAVADLELPATGVAAQLRERDPVRRFRSGRGLADCREGRRRSQRKRREARLHPPHGTPRPASGAV